MKKALCSWGDNNYQNKKAKRDCLEGGGKVFPFFFFFFFLIFIVLLCSALTLRLNDIFGVGIILFCPHI